MKEMNIDDWVTPSSAGRGVIAEPYGFSYPAAHSSWTRPDDVAHLPKQGLACPFRSSGFYDEMIGVIVYKTSHRGRGVTVTYYTVMWSNGDMTQNWHRNQLKHARNKKQK